MRTIGSALVTGSCAIALLGCGGGGSNAAPQSPVQTQISGLTVTGATTTVVSTVPATLTLNGSASGPVTATATAGQTIMVPKGTQISLPVSGLVASSTINIGGDNDTITIPPGAVITVPAGATGPADNAVIVDTTTAALKPGATTLTLSGSGSGPETTTAVAGETILVPKGTQVVEPGSGLVANTTLNINGDNNAATIAVGSVVTVPAGATGPADNTLTVQ